MADETIDLLMKIHQRGPHTILVSIDDELDNAKWIQKRDIVVTKKPRGLVEITMSEDLAISKGFV